MSGRAAAIAAACASLALVPGRAPAGPPAPPRSALARVERTDVRLGAPFAYEVEVVHPAAEEVALAPALDAPPFRGAGGSCRREPAGPGEVRTTCAMRLALLDLGPHDVPAPPLVVRRPEGEAPLAVEGPRVTGVGLSDPEVPAAALSLRPLAPPVPLLVPTWAPLLRALAAAAAIGVALLARRAWRRRTRAAAEPPPPEPPDARLARRLDALAAARPSPRDHLVELSSIVREWIAGVTGLPAPGLTTAELDERLGADGDPRVDGAAVVGFLREADLVKFAGAAATPERCAAASAWARRLPATAAARLAARRASGPAPAEDRP